jgi:hypothetical protein
MNKREKAEIFELGIADLARQLDAYMRFRANREGVGYELNPQFFHEALCQGCTQFFGVTMGANPACGSFAKPTEIFELAGDEQNPEAFAEWRRQRRAGYHNSDLQ